MSEVEEKRICFLTAQFAVGGADNLLMSVCSHLVAQGCKIVIYSAIPGRNPRLEERCHALGIEVRYAVGMGMRGRIVLNHLKYSRSLLSRCLDSRFDRSEIFEQVRDNHRTVMERHINPGYISRFVRRVQLDHKKEPFSAISGFHSTLLPALYALKQRTGIPVYYTEISSPKYRSTRACEGLAAAGRYLNALDHVIVPSPRIEAELQEFEGLGRPATVIPFVVDLPPFEYRPPERAARTFGIIARLSREKNQDVLIRALPLVRKRVPDARLVLIGTGPQEREYHALAQNLNVDQYIEWIPSFDRLEQVIDKIDIVTLISDVEGMPLTIMEALFFGKPIVATGVGSVPDMVLTGENGFVVDKNPDEIADKIIQLLSNHQLIRSMSKRSRQIFESSYANETVNRKILEVYD